ncbi:MAG: phenylalanine--tRNA ligase subunit beta [Acidobacteria bacterium]|nr:phenylalanine--tRNA ligase subunit beta [Acidobacteriota bacterium]
MKFSYNWICELVEGVDAAPQDLMRLITMKTAECEGVEEHGAHLRRVCAARVVSVEPIAGGHNVKAVVETGRYGTKTVVCGAPNCRAGMTGVYVPAGTRLGEREIGQATIGGIVSDGMLASGAELGLNRDAGGILEIEAAPGDAIPGCRPDWIIEIDNKSLTHRPDLWGHHGMAREVAAILRKPLREPARLELVPPGQAPVKVEIADFGLCPRYSALVFDNVKVQPSPLWLQARLESIGLNPINNIVDVTNFVLAEIAQPMHAFDAAALGGGTIFVRPARKGEKLVALNQERYELDETNLVIADAGGPVAIAGVIGGLDTGIVDTTTRVILESANFHASGIRKTSSKLKLRTDASIRYEKSQDPVNTLRGLARAIELFAMVSPGIRIVGGLEDCKKELAVPQPIALPMEWLLRKLGRAIAAEEVRDILERLHFGVAEPEPGVFSVRVPSWRATRDVAIKDDLVEEVGRIIGYDTIPPRAPLLAARVPPVNEERRFHHQLRDLVAAQGFTEVYNYSFIHEQLAARFGFAPEAHIAVANPISEEQGLMRLSLVPGLWRNITENAKHFENFRLFEIGYEIHKRENEELPDEVGHLAAAIYGREDTQSGIFELKRLAECLLPGAEVRPAAACPFEHPARAAELLWRGALVGRLVELHPSLIEIGRASILDIDLREMDRLRHAEKRYQPIRRYPVSAFDLSVLAPPRDLIGDIEKKLVALAGADLDSIEFVRQYAGPPLPEGVKSVSFRLTVAAPDRTLAPAEAGAIRQRIIDGMHAAGYQLRLG